MSLHNTGKHSRSATILIETRQITSHLEKANDFPDLRCFISTAWDLVHDRPIDQRLSYDGTLAKATIRSPEMLSKSSTDSTCSSSGCHLKRWYQYHGVRHEVCVIHNGRVWLRPIGSMQLAANVTSHNDALPSNQRPVERQTETSAWTRAQPFQGPYLPKSRASLARQPSDIQRLVGYYAETMYLSANMTKTELSRRMQAEIQAINLSRPADDQLKIPSLRTLCWFIDEYFLYALSQGLAARRWIIKKFAVVDSKPFDRQVISIAKQSPPELDQ